MKGAEITMLAVVFSMLMFTATVSGQTCNPPCVHGVCSTTSEGTVVCLCTRCWTGSQCSVRIVSEECPSDATISKDITYRTGGSRVTISRTGDQGSGTSTGTGSGTSTGTGTSGGSGSPVSSTNPCSPNPCQGRGYCQVDSNSGFRCTCVNIRSGLHCKTVLSTPRNPRLETPFPCRRGQSCQPKGRDQIGVICT